MGAIYALINPEINEPYYVGLTIDVVRRQHDHLHSKPRVATIEFLERGITPIFRVLCEYANCDLQDAEQAWINRMLDRGYNLDNASDCRPFIYFVSDDNDYSVIFHFSDGSILPRELQMPYHLTEQGKADAKKSVDFKSLWESFKRFNEKETGDTTQ